MSTIIKARPGVGVADLDRDIIGGGDEDSGSEENILDSNESSCEKD